MTDRGILFSAPMVRALLAGRKTTTRRLAWRTTMNPGGPISDAAGGQMDFIEPHEEHKPTIWQKVQAGDRLWVREAFMPRPHLETIAKPHYRADEDRPEWRGQWRPSIHLPRRLSRLTLTVTAVKIEPAQTISDADALAEGIFWSDDWEGYSSDDEGRHYHSSDPAKSFASLWMTLHGDDSWFANPDVVAMSFTVEPRNIDALGIEAGTAETQSGSVHESPTAIADAPHD